MLEKLYAANDSKLVLKVLPAIGIAHGEPFGPIAPRHNRGFPVEVPLLADGTDIWRAFSGMSTLVKIPTVPHQPL